MKGMAHGRKQSLWKETGKTKNGFIYRNQGQIGFELLNKTEHCFSKPWREIIFKLMFSMQTASQRRISKSCLNYFQKGQVSKTKFFEVLCPSASYWRILSKKKKREAKEVPEYKARMDPAREEKGGGGGICCTKCTDLHLDGFANEKDCRYIVCVLMQMSVSLAA